MVLRHVVTAAPRLAAAVLPSSDCAKTTRPTSAASAGRPDPGTTLQAGQPQCLSFQSYVEPPQTLVGPVLLAQLTCLALPPCVRDPPYQRGLFRDPSG